LSFGLVEEVERIILEVTFETPRVAPCGVSSFQGMKERKRLSRLAGVFQHSRLAFCPSAEIGGPVENATARFQIDRAAAANALYRQRGGLDREADIV
jgi:hypothetical protein